MNLNYTLFTQKFNINASVSHAFVNNSIEQYTFMDTERPNVSVSTYGNIGKRHQTGFSLYMNWSPVPLFRFFMNGGVDYISMENEERNLSNSGWSGRAFAGVNFRFRRFPAEHERRLYVTQDSITRKRSDFLFHGITLNKDFFHKKLTFSVYCKSPLMKTWKMENKTYNNAFTLYETENKVMREFGISVSYRFGSLTDTFRKIKRGIVNDDVKDCGERTSISNDSIMITNRYSRTMWILMLFLSRLFHLSFELGVQCLYACQCGMGENTILIDISRGGGLYGVFKPIAQRSLILAEADISLRKTSAKADIRSAIFSLSML